MSHSPSSSTSLAFIFLLKTINFQFTIVQCVLTWIIDLYSTHLHYLNSALISIFKHSFNAFDFDCPIRLSLIHFIIRLEVTRVADCVRQLVCFSHLIAIQCMILSFAILVIGCYFG